MLRRIQYLLIAIIVASSAPGAGRAQGHGVERSLVGVWEVVTTPRNCATGNPIPTAAFESIYTFNRDGTMYVSLRNTSASLTRTLAHGVWRRAEGWRVYAFKFVHLRTNNSDLTFFGKQEAAGALVLDESGDGFTTDSLNQVYTAAGDPLPTAGCANSVGIRFSID